MTNPGPVATLGADDAVLKLPLIETLDPRAGRRDATASLVLRARQGEAAAFEQLVAPRVDRLYRLGLAILRSEADARDAVQETIVSSWRSLPSLRDPDRLDPWMDRILVNACRMVIRHRRVVRVREISLSDPDGDPRPNALHLSQVAPDEEVVEMDRIRQAFSRLDADQRALIVLHHVEGRPIDEIAAVLGIPTGTVKWRLHAARSALQRLLDEVRR